MFSVLNVLNLVLVRFYPLVNLKVIFLNSPCIKSFFFPFKDRLICSQGLKSFSRQFAEIMMTSTSEKRSGDFKLGKLNILKP